MEAEILFIASLFLRGLKRLQRTARPEGARPAPSAPNGGTNTNTAATHFVKTTLPLVSPFGGRKGAVFCWYTSALLKVRGVHFEAGLVHGVGEGGGLEVVGVFFFALFG